MKKGLKKIVGALALGASCSLCAMAGNGVKCDVPVVHDWWWQAGEVPEVTVLVSDSLGERSNAEIRLEISTDTKLPICSMSQTVTVLPGDTAKVKFSTNQLGAGFYRCNLTADGRQMKQFNIGVDPEKVVSAPDAQPDLRQFWDNALAELAKVAPNYKMKLDKKKSTKMRRIYEVSMASLGGETVKGYLAVPVKKGTYPTLVYYMGYGSKPWCPDANGNPEMVEFVVSVRGQALNEPTNKYGDWVVWNLQDPNSYYYRGAFMDLVRAVDFIWQLPQADHSRIYAEGGSQGGAFTLAAAALDHRFAAIAPWIPFLSDYPDYFKIVHWPAEPILAKQKELGMTDAQLYRNLSYFDIKNIAPWIECPVLMGIGLQDPTCPPHTNFSGYNNLKVAKKEFVIYPLCGHDVMHPEWEQKRSEFFAKIRKM